MFRLIDHQKIKYIKDIEKITICFVDCLQILQNDQIMKGNGSQEQTDGERFALNQSPTGSKKSCSC